MNAESDWCCVGYALVVVLRERVKMIRIRVSMYRIRAEMERIQVSMDPVRAGMMSARVSMRRIPGAMGAVRLEMTVAVAPGYPAAVLMPGIGWTAPVRGWEVCPRVLASGVFTAGVCGAMLAGSVRTSNQFCAGNSARWCCGPRWGQKENECRTGAAGPCR